MLSISLLCVYMYTYWFFVTDHPIEGDDVWVFELGHDGCLLEELHFVLYFGSHLKSFQGNLQLFFAASLPTTLFNITKLTRPKVARYPRILVGSTYKLLLLMHVHACAYSVIVPNLAVRYALYSTGLELRVDLILIGSWCVVGIQIAINVLLFVLVSDKFT